MDSYEKFVADKEVLQDIVSETSKALVEYSAPFKNDIGLIPFNVIKSDEYQKYRIAYDVANRNLGNLNRSVPKQWLRQASKDRRKAREVKTFKDVPLSEMM